MDLDRELHWFNKKKENADRYFEEALYDATRIIEESKEYIEELEEKIRLLQEQLDDGGV